MKVRSVFISDVHLGSKGCRAEELADFLDALDCEYLFLVGDIIDLWKLQVKWYWPHKHSRIIKKLLSMSKNTRVIYIPGNHDEVFRAYSGVKFGEIEIHREFEYKLKNGERALVLHGDRFDRVICHQKWLAKLGGRAYESLVIINRIFNNVRKFFGYKYWSLAKYLKLKAKKAVKVIDNFEESVTMHAQREGFSHVVCGHIHKTAIDRKNSVMYYNCGDWVESCTAIIEDHDGKISLYEHA